MSCQIGARIPIRSALVTFETGISPMRGKAYRSRLLSHSRACSGERQPGRSWFQTCPRRLCEGGRRLGPPLLGQEVATVTGQLPVRERLLARFLQRNQGVSAEPELGSAAADREALDPPPATRGPDIEIEAVAVAIAPGLAHVADEDGRESVLGMPAARLAFRRSLRECHTYQYIGHKVVEARGWSGTIADKMEPHVSL